MLIALPNLLIASPIAAGPSRGASVAVSNGQKAHGIRHFRPSAADSGRSNASHEQLDGATIRLTSDAADAPSIDPATIPFMGKTIRILGQ